MLRADLFKVGSYCLILNKLCNNMDGLHLDYVELATIAAALLYRSAVPDYSGVYRSVFDKFEYFLKNSDSNNFYLQQILP